jgi:hypothetical protein
MFLAGAFATFVALATWTASVTADLRITADHHSWGGVNYPLLQFFDPPHRDDTIRALVKAKVRVVRLFSEFKIDRSTVNTDCFVPVRPDEYHSDVRSKLHYQSTGADSI